MKLKRKTDIIKPEKKHIALGIYAYGTLILAFGLMAFILYWLLYPYNVIDFKSDYKLASRELTQGETTTYSISYCKYLDPPTTVTKQFVDGLIFQMESPSTRLLLGCHTQVVPLYIPLTLPPGNYKVRVTAKYQVNPIRTLTEVSQTEVFTVKRNATGAYGDNTNGGVQPTTIK